MISGRMSRPFRVLLSMGALAAVATFASACGTERIKVSQSQSSLHRGAQLFQQRCSGCHTLSYAATQGSATNVRTAEQTNGPNLDQRCERPVSRVLYAIENGGFSGAIMPQNVIVGRDAADVAQFVSKYAGTKAAKVPGVPVCNTQPIGSLPAPSAVTASSPASSNSTTSTTSTGSLPPTGGATGTHKTGAKTKAKAKKKHKKK
jgi:mono/diheme cytochrome c family protein